MLNVGPPRAKDEHNGMIGRLLIGLVKGLVVGGLLGFLLAKVGMAAPIAVVAYLAAALTGVLVGLIAGKPIWAKDAKIEAGMKAGVGALLSVGLMFAIRRWITMPLPFSIGPLGEVAPGQVGALGMLAIPSLAMMAAVLAGFYEADNTPAPVGESKDAPASSESAAAAKRIATAGDEADEEALEDEPQQKRAKK